MSTVELTWYAFVVAACLMALADWRLGIYIGILVDVLRDPVRKLVPEEPVIITLSGAVVWLVIVAVAVFAKQTYVRSLFRNYSGVRTAMHLVIIALLPAFGISCISYTRGWLMASIGAASYVVPMLGIAAGFALAEKEKEIVRVLRFYILVNVIMLLSVPMEYLKMDVPALGGIDTVWIRYRTGYIVDLMCGWYRSPDIMGLHAAHVIMFSMLLAVQKSNGSRSVWISAAVWAAICVLLSGRRKMIGIPLVFGATFLLLGTIYRVARVNRFAGIAAVAACFGGAALVFVWGEDESADYTQYASSLFTEGGERVNGLILGGVYETLRQSGLIGAGLGTATQGRYYAGVSASGNSRGWQEDGISRLFLEFGVPGVLLLVCAVCLLVGAVAKSMRLLRNTSTQILLQLGLVAVVAGDAASYAISHQQFSGDPVSALIVTLMIGMVLGLPGAYFAEQRIKMTRQPDGEQKPADISEPNTALLAVAASTIAEGPGRDHE